MSRAIASARQRRAGITPEPPQPIQQQQQTQQGLTLPQVISVVDARLIKLEKFMNESQQQSTQVPQQQYVNQPSNAEKPQYVSPNFINEIEARFDLLAQEIMVLKDTILKLQTYTMDVNKMLLDERSPVENTGFFMENGLVSDLVLNDVNNNDDENDESIIET